MCDLLQPVKCLSKAGKATTQKLQLGKRRPASKKKRWLKPREKQYDEPDESDVLPYSEDNVHDRRNYIASSPRLQVSLLPDFPSDEDEGEGEKKQVVTMEAVLADHQEDTNESILVDPAMVRESPPGVFSVRGTSAFLAPGRDARKRPSSAPPPGHYEPRHSCIFPRTRSPYFGARKKHRARGSPLRGSSSRPATADDATHTRADNTTDDAHPKIRGHSVFVSESGRFAKRTQRDLGTEMMYDSNYDVIAPRVPSPVDIRRTPARPDPPVHRALDVFYDYDDRTTRPRSAPPCDWSRSPAHTKRNAVGESQKTADLDYPKMRDDLTRPRVPSPLAMSKTLSRQKRNEVAERKARLDVAVDAFYEVADADAALAAHVPAVDMEKCMGRPHAAPRGTVDEYYDVKLEGIQPHTRQVIFDRQTGHEFPVHDHLDVVYDVDYGQVDRAVPAAEIGKLAPHRQSTANKLDKFYDADPAVGRKRNTEPVPFSQLIGREERCKVMSPAPQTPDIMYSPNYDAVEVRAPAHQFQADKLHGMFDVCWDVDRRNYHPNDKLTRPSSPEWTFSRSKRQSGVFG